MYILGLFIAQPILGNAEQTADSTADNLPTFNYEVIKPENQVDSSVGYFDLHMEPGKKQTIQIKLSNPSSVEVTIEVGLNGAITNSKGVIEYGSDFYENDASLKFPFEDVVSGPEEVTLAPGEEKMLDINIAMPETSFEGYISGGIQLTRKGQETESESMVINKISYMIGLLLSEQSLEEIESIPEELKFNKIYPENYNYRNAFIVNFSNVKPIYMDDISADVQIMKSGSEEVLYESKKTQMRMAPNTMLTFPISLNGEAMVAGEYRAKIAITSVKGGKWTWDETFTITDEEAEKFNEKDLALVQDPGLNWQLIAMIAGGVLGTLLIIFFIVRFMKSRKKGKKGNRKKSKKKNTNTSGKKKERN